MPWGGDLIAAKSTGRAGPFVSVQTSQIFASPDRARTAQGRRMDTMPTGSEHCRRTPGAVGVGVVVELAGA